MKVRVPHTCTNVSVHFLGWCKFSVVCFCYQKFCLTNQFCVVKYSVDSVVSCLCTVYIFVLLWQTPRHSTRPLRGSYCMLFSLLRSCMVSIIAYIKHLLHRSNYILCPVSIHVTCPCSVLCNNLCGLHFPTCYSIMFSFQLFSLLNRLTHLVLCVQRQLQVTVSLSIPQYWMLGA